MKSSVICVILFFTRVCLLSVLGPSTLLKHISAYSCTVFSYIYFTLRSKPAVLPDPFTQGSRFCNPKAPFFTACKRPFAGV